MLSIPAHPIKRNWRALKNEGKKEGNAVANHHATSCINKPAYPRIGEDAQVEEEKADFGKSDGSDIEELLDVVNLLQLVGSIPLRHVVPYLEDLRDFVEFQGPYIFSQASLPNCRLVRISVPVIL
jgi:hypothetical protein